MTDKLLKMLKYCAVYYTLSSKSACMIAYIVFSGFTSEQEYTYQLQLSLRGFEYANKLKGADNIRVTHTGLLTHTHTH